MCDYDRALRIVHINEKRAAKLIAAWIKSNLFPNVNFAIQHAGTEIVAEREVVQFVGPASCCLPNS